MEALMKTAPEFEDQLDPCCMREMLDRKKANTLQSKLRRYDRSKIALDARSGVIKNLKAVNRHTCAECVNPKDYDLLVMVRNQAHIISEVDEEEVVDSDNDSVFDDLDDFVSDFELEMRSKIAQQQKEKEEFQHTYGFGAHRYDSVMHLQLSIQLGYPVVLHICDPSSISCAYLDVALEKCASKYVGTKFRRLYCSDRIRDFLEFYHVSRASDSNAMLMTFHNGQVAADSIVYDISQYVTCNSSNDNMGLKATTTLIENYLQQVHILRDQLPDVREIRNRIYLYKLRFKSNKNSHNGDANIQNVAVNEGMIVDYERQCNEYPSSMDNADEVSEYSEDESIDSDSGSEDEETANSCGVAGCTRSFAHSHVGVGGDNVFGLVQQTGMEALAKDFYSKI